MIVIATHNGGRVLNGLLRDLKSFHIPNNDICIVDNKSTDLIYIAYLMILKEKNYNILFNPYDTYEVGAFKLAIETFKSDVWFCIQDSIKIKENIFEMVIPKLTNKNVYTFLTFNPGQHDDKILQSNLEKHYQTLTYSKGLFGNMFFARNEVVQLVKDDWFIPKDKKGSELMERGLPVVFDKHNIEIIGLARLGVDDYTCFSKVHDRTDNIHYK